MSLSIQINMLNTVNINNYITCNVIRETCNVIRETCNVIRETCNVIREPFHGTPILSMFLRGNFPININKDL
jgi:hypothetical protein